MMSTVLGLVLLAMHPLGNFTVNQYAGVRVAPDVVTVDYVLDMAELPAYQTRGEISDEKAWAARACTDVAGATSIHVDGRPAPVAVSRATVEFPAGQAGLATLRLECTLEAHTTVQRDSIVVHRNGAYPGGALDTPRNVTSATLKVRPGGPSLVDSPRAAAQPANGADRLTATFVSFVGRPGLSLGLGLVALLLSLLLGALHAFAPGHGKTVLAAYLVAEKGSLRHALAVAATVTATHTAGVLVLGVVLTTSLRFAPERLYGWLAAASGLLLAGVGAAMLRRARRRPRHQHHHHHHHDRIRLRGLLTMGFAGGLAPSPSAVVVLLGAVALGRTWFGVLLVLGYGVGMAAALAALGAILARWRGRFARRTTGRLAHALPVLAAGLVLLVGLSLAVRAVIDLALAG